MSVTGITACSLPYIRCSIIRLSKMANDTQSVVNQSINPSA